MSKKISKLIIKIVAILIILGLIFQIIIYTIVYAEGPEAELLPPDLDVMLENAKNSIGEASAFGCEKDLARIFDLETLKFFKFVETTLQSDYDTGTLTNNILSAFVEYRREIRDNMAKVHVDTQVSSLEGFTFQESLSGFQGCVNLSETYIDAAKQEMIRQIKNNQAQKNTTTLMEKFDDLDQKMRKLNLLVARLYGMFGAFRAKLPGFLSKCF